MINLNNEKKYTDSSSVEHIKAFGQYFTNHSVADFMCSWACENSKSMLDPAVGNSIFLLKAKKYSPLCSLTGYEIDKHILDYFGNPAEAQILNTDYLLADWNQKFDSIVCNPPYGRFQSIKNRNQIIDCFQKNTGNKLSNYTNLYIFFLFKSIFQLSKNGKLAYLIPSEFLNSKYGDNIKKLLIEKRLLSSIINFENDSDLFYNATTTNCILLIDKTQKDYVSFYNLNSIEDLNFEYLNNPLNANHVSYNSLKATEKWRTYINQETLISYNNIKSVSDFCTVTRGIATGANDFFCFSLSKAESLGIPKHFLKKCICRSADIKVPIFNPRDFELLSAADKTVYLLDITDKDKKEIENYIDVGEKNSVNKRHLLSTRKPWYSMEKKEIAPIWVTSACRSGMKFVRNNAQINTLTTFHSIYIKGKYQSYTDIIFCYFLTSVGQNLLMENRKVLGNGLDKFQPNDLNSANMLDVTLISSNDCDIIMEIYKKIEESNEDYYTEELNKIFTKYVS